MFIINNDQNKDHLEMNEQVTVTEPAADLSWESLASVEQSRQNDLISEIYKLGNRIDEDGRIDGIKAEWEEASDGDDSHLEAEFEKALSVYEDRQKNMRAAQKIKQELVEEALELKDSSKWAKTSKRLQAMQETWRTAGFAGQDTDQELWEAFSEANDVFFNRQNEFFDKREELQEVAAEKKEALIAEAEAHKESSDWKETSAKMRDLMEAWKEVGFASREVEDELWERFNGARQHFYQRQHEHFDEMRKRHAEAKKIKEDLIVKAEALANQVKFEGREAMDQLFAEWKEAGSSGRANEQGLWDQFKAHQDKFFQRFNEYKEANSEERRFDLEEEIKTLEVRINALEEITDMVKIKLDSFAGMASLDEAQKAEKEQLEANLETNEIRLEEYYRTLNSLRDELEYM